MKNFCILLLILTLCSYLASERSKTFQSSNTQTMLLELYTSEGCSSCPPAEKWLANWTDSKQLWSQMVPIAFHVDYWDRLGWKDKFASKEYTNRQYSYASHWKSRRVYTPCFVANGNEWRGWFRGTGLPRSSSKVGVLKATAWQSGKVQVTFAPAARNVGNLDAHVALLGCGVVSRIRAGENYGKTLSHDFVVLDYARQKLASKQGKWTATVNLSSRVKATVQSYAVAIWVTKGATPIQATGGYWTE